MTAFEKSLKDVLGIEAGYSDNPNDSGGKTRFGITEALARRYGYQGDMRRLPKPLAIKIYRLEFWDNMQLNQVAAISSVRIAEELFEAGVNVGHRVAVGWLQRCLNLLNQRGRWWPDIQVDGRLGEKTLFALQAHVARRPIQGIPVLLRMLNTLQGNHYIELTERREKDEAFVFGWISHRVRIDP